MHVTSFKMTAKPGERQAIIDDFNRWDKERKPKAAGFVRAALYSNQKNPDEFMSTVVFDSTESYTANSSDPELGRTFNNKPAPNPCAGKANPCEGKANPCAANPCGGR